MLKTVIVMGPDPANWTRKAMYVLGVQDLQPDFANTARVLLDDRNLEQFIGVADNAGYHVLHDSYVKWGEPSFV